MFVSAKKCQQKAKKKQTALKFVENHYLIVIDMWFGLPTVYLSYQNEGTEGFQFSDLWLQ